jgi:hypothetical protein
MSRQSGDKHLRLCGLEDLPSESHCKASGTASVVGVMPIVQALGIVKGCEEVNNVRIRSGCLQAELRS